MKRVMLCPKLRRRQRLEHLIKVTEHCLPEAPMLWSSKASTRRRVCAACAHVLPSVPLEASRASRLFALEPCARKLLRELVTSVATPKRADMSRSKVRTQASCAPAPDEDAAAVSAAKTPEIESSTMSRAERCDTLPPRENSARSSSSVWHKWAVSSVRHILSCASRTLAPRLAISWFRTKERSRSESKASVASR
eukprot:1688363-Pleurochrysis_carterae.AAC.2